MFDDIRPYLDSEIPAAMRRIAADPLFPAVAGYVFPSRPLEDVRKEILAVNTIRDFQTGFMTEATRAIMRNTIDSFSYSGLENVDLSRAHVFISNHRDIVLDASLLQIVLLEHGQDTTEITFGANLMRGNLVVDIGKSNKMFRVERPGNDIRAFYESSGHLSEYIFHTVGSRKQSIWIAQRNGRTKDGIDRTDPGIINMFTMGCDLSPVDTLATLSLHPVAVSYEWEPCDFLKGVELVKKESGPYVKAEGEDFNSIMTGLLQRKGRVHLHICPEIRKEDLEPLRGGSTSSFRKRVAEIVDSRICSAYRLFPNNYIAHDLRSGSSTYASHYTAEQKDVFVRKLAALHQYDGLYDCDKLTDYMLGIYAGPVDSFNRFVR